MVVRPADDRAVEHVEAAVIFRGSWERRQKSREVTVSLPDTPEVHGNTAEHS